MKAFAVFALAFAAAFAGCAYKGAETKKYFANFEYCATSVTEFSTGS
jgi:hypothetical protein